MLKSFDLLESGCYSLEPFRPLLPESEVGVDDLVKLIERLEGSDRKDRLAALDELEAKHCHEPLDTDVRRRIGSLLARNLLARDTFERKRVARFLDVWHKNEPDRALANQYRAIFLEEVDPEIRNSLLVAISGTLPNAALIEQVAEPDPEYLREGYALLVMLEAVQRRIRMRSFNFTELVELLDALRVARSHRGSHIARPFLWHLEVVIQDAKELCAWLTPKGKLTVKPAR